MFACTLCHFEVEYDDVQLRLSTSDGVCICLRCYARETDTTKAMTKGLRLEIIALLTAAPTT